MCGKIGKIERIETNTNFLFFGATFLFFGISSFWVALSLGIVSNNLLVVVLGQHISWKYFHLEQASETLG